MSNEPLPYSPFYIRAWTALTLALGLLLYILFAFGDHFMHAGHVLWSLIRWIFSPII